MRARDKSFSCFVSNPRVTDTPKAWRRQRVNRPNVPIPVHLPNPRLPVTTAAALPLAAFPSVPSWPSVPTAAAVPSLIISFLLGGIFFASILPRLLVAVWALFQRLFHDKSSSSSKAKSSRPQPRRLANNLFGRRQRKEQIQVKSIKVSRRQLVVFQYIVDQLIQLSFQTQLERAFTHALKEVENPNIRSIQLHSFQCKSSPNLRQGVILHSNPDNMAFDIQFAWINAFEATIHIVTRRLGLMVPIQMYGTKLVGTARIALTPLVETPPGFGANMFSFLDVPAMDLDVKVSGGRITKVPWLKKEIIKALQNIFQKQLVWPKRVVNPSLLPNHNATLVTQQELLFLHTYDPFGGTQQNVTTGSPNQQKPQSNDESSLPDDETQNASFQDDVAKVLDDVLQPFIREEEEEENVATKPVVHKKIKSNDADNDEEEEEEEEEDGLNFDALQEVTQDSIEQTLRKMRNVRSLDEFFSKGNDEDNGDRRLTNAGILKMSNQVGIRMGRLLSNLTERRYKKQRKTRPNNARQPRNNPIPVEWKRFQRTMGNQIQKVLRRGKKRGNDD